MSSTPERRQTKKMVDVCFLIHRGVLAGTWLAVSVDLGAWPGMRFVAVGAAGGDTGEIRVESVRAGGPYLPVSAMPNESAICLTSSALVCSLTLIALSPVRLPSKPSTSPSLFFRAVLSFYTLLTPAFVLLPCRNRMLMSSVLPGVALLSAGRFKPAFVVAVAAVVVPVGHPVDVWLAARLEGRVAVGGRVPGRVSALDVVTGGAAAARMWNRLAQIALQPAIRSDRLETWRCFCLASLCCCLMLIERLPPPTSSPSAAFPTCPACLLFGHIFVNLGGSRRSMALTARPTCDASEQGVVVHRPLRRFGADLELLVPEEAVHRLCHYRSPFLRDRRVFVWTWCICCKIGIQICCESLPRLDVVNDHLRPHFHGPAQDLARVLEPAHSVLSKMASQLVEILLTIMPKRMMRMQEFAGPIMSKMLALEIEAHTPHLIQLLSSRPATSISVSMLSSTAYFLPAPRARSGQMIWALELEEARRCGVAEAVRWVETLHLAKIWRDMYGTLCLQFDRILSHQYYHHAAAHLFEQQARIQPLRQRLTQSYFGNLEAGTSTTKTRRHNLEQRNGLEYRQRNSTLNTQGSSGILSLKAAGVDMT
ncbi:hypothetical protein P153DRAFT_361819 [Dothidotthia symphoricarpi CBS 119687]|uniref:Uncharacterized protein n=1 Tax=Dothidotthia symphoricarpi CBS 119687 TaxID=1392245 RepID=A0A6A5ZXE3_9PLEO|nr:uncharacterized protein P153DRAFT_361819 [Dothidotthia symphoricarpi CBS 119687]KAF2123695.1 hypothetical protein P153DRAFT_361819 [Dothidotthia symphoricarpi CBS 119687]